jgi:hypothetical protein
MAMHRSRPRLLKRDGGESAEAAILTATESYPLPIGSCPEPEQRIARARSRTVAFASGVFLDTRMRIPSDGQPPRGHVFVWCRGAIVCAPRHTRAREACLRPALGPPTGLILSHRTDLTASSMLVSPWWHHVYGPSSPCVWGDLGGLMGSPCLMQRLAKLRCHAAQILATVKLHWAAEHTSPPSVLHYVPTRWASWLLASLAL